ncbi:MAG: hypothetical protein HY904_07460 [Deltaproteobacteria bacterium]|nr:hypothetical protein [Deltaproteobacteria bacterium]
MIVQLLRWAGRWRATALMTALVCGASVSLEAALRFLTGRDLEPRATLMALAIPALVAAPNIAAHFKVILRLERTRELLAESNAALAKALSEVKELHGLLPICSSCKQIRDEEGNWHAVEAYVSHRSKAHFTHGFCPACAKRLYDVD